MSAGMMPAFDLPGEAIPGQFGPTIRVVFPLAHACAQNTAVSCTVTPSVITTTTVPNPGTAVSPRSTVWPALRGLVPPTIFVPAASILRPCFVPSEPVMPWIMIRLSPVRKIAISCSRRGRVAAVPISAVPTSAVPIDRRPGARRPGGGQLRGAPRRVVHGRDLLNHGEACFFQDAPTLSRVVSVQAHHDRVVHLLAAVSEHADCRNDAVRDRVAGGDAAEHVDEDTADRRVGQHDLQAVGHY